MEKEIWKPVVGYEEFYEVSSLGRMKSLERVLFRRNGARMSYPEKIMKPHTDKNGYDTVSLYNGIKRVTRFVHTLVCMAFIQNPHNKPCVDHINGDRRDNRVENLRWCTIKENNSFDLARKHNSDAHSGGKNPMFGKFGSAHHRSKTVYQYAKDGTLVGMYGSSREAARITGLWQRNISAACLGRVKTCGGYIWRYLDKQ